MKQLCINKIMVLELINITGIININNFFKFEEQLLSY